MYNTVPVCLQCYTVLNQEIAIPCEKCGWPLCQNCNEHGLECKFSSSRRDSKVIIILKIVKIHWEEIYVISQISITEFGYPHPSYQCINVIRALSLKDTNPESYKKLISLESHCNEMNNSKEPLNIAHFIKRFFKADDISEEEIVTIIGILQVKI